MVPVLAEPAVPDVKAVIRRAKLDRVSVVAVSIELARRQKSIEGLARGDRGSREQAAEVVEEREWEVVCQCLVDESRPRAEARRRARSDAGWVVHPRVRGAVRGRSAPGRPVSGGPRPARGRACVGPPGSPIGGPSTRHRLGRGSSGSVTDRSSPGSTIRRWTVRWSCPVLHACPHQGSAPQPYAHRGAARDAARDRVPNLHHYHHAITVQSCRLVPLARLHGSRVPRARRSRAEANEEPHASRSACLRPGRRGSTARRTRRHSNGQRLARGHQMDHDPRSRRQRVRHRPAFSTRSSGPRVEGALLTDCSGRSVTPGPSAWTMRVATVSYTDSS